MIPKSSPTGGGGSPAGDDGGGSARTGPLRLTPLGTSPEGGEELVRLARSADARQGHAMPTVRIAHALSRAEVRRRMERRVGDLHKLLPGDRGTIEAAWKSENAMTITVRVMGQVIESVATNERGALVIDYALPGGMGFIAPMVDAVIRRAGDKLLLGAG